MDKISKLELIVGSEVNEVFTNVNLSMLDCQRLALVKLLLKVEDEEDVEDIWGLVNFLDFVCDTHFNIQEILEESMDI